MKVSEIVKNITEIQDSNYVKLMNEEELNLFKKYIWLVWNSIKRIEDVEVVMKIADNQITLERIMDKPQQWYSVLIDVIPKGKYSQIYPKKIKKKNYDYEFINLLAKDFQISTRECEDYYDILEHQGILEDEKFKLNSKYGIEYEPPQEKLDNIQTIEKLKKHGLKFEIDESDKNVSSVLVGKSFVVSGIFSKYSRDEIKKLIELNGGKVSSSISKNTSFILAGENMGPSKKQKAEELGIKIISEEDFVKIIYP